MIFGQSLWSISISFFQIIFHLLYFGRTLMCITHSQIFISSAIVDVLINGLLQFLNPFNSQPDSSYLSSSFEFVNIQIKFFSWFLSPFRNLSDFSFLCMAKSGSKRYCDFFVKPYGGSFIVIFFIELGETEPCTVFDAFVLPVLFIFGIPIFAAEFDDL